MRIIILNLLMLIVPLAVSAQENYEGETNSKGLPHGKGKISWSADSVTFEGNFKKGRPYGRGTWTQMKNGTVYMVYTGEIGVYDDGKGGYKVFPNGQGQGVRQTDGIKFNGPWVKGSPRGWIEYPGDNFNVKNVNISVPPGYSGVAGSANENATTFFRKAVAQENLENARIFLSKGASVLGDGKQINPLYDAIKNKDKEMIDLIYQANSNAIKYSQAIHYACATSDSTMIDYLVSKGASLDLNGYVCRFNHVNVRNEPLYEWNADSRYILTPADVALRYGKSDNVYYLARKYKKIPTKYGFSQLLVAAIEQGKDEYANTLLSLIPSLFPAWYVNAPSPSYNENYTGMFPLIAALRKNNARMAIRLLQLGANPNVRFSHTENSRVLGLGGFDQVSNPLFEAVTRPGMIDVIELMFKKGAVPYGDIMRRARDEYKEFFMLNGLM